MLSKLGSLTLALATLALIVAPTIASTTTQSLTTVATLTALPPASSTGNNTDPCGFTDRGICTLVYGSGNPDISGIGAMISYIIQGLAVFIFGPCLILAARTFGVLDRDWKLEYSNLNIKSQNRVTLLLRTCLNVCQISMLVALSTSVASIIRTTQTPPLHELSFLFVLEMYQCMMGLSTFVTAFIWSMRGEYIRMKDFVVYMLDGLVVFLSFIGMLSARVSEADTPTERRLLWYCNDPTALYVEEDPNQTPQFWGPIPITLAALLATYVIFLLVRCFYRQAVNHIHEKIDRILWHYFAKTLKDIVKLFWILIAVLIWGACCLAFIMILQTQRRETQLSSGNAYEDNVWGFGQVTILLLWIPLLLDIFLDTLEYAGVKPDSTSKNHTQVWEFSALLPPANATSFLSSNNLLHSNDEGNGEIADDDSVVTNDVIEEINLPPYNDEELAGLGNLQMTTGIAHENEVDDRFFQHDTDGKPLPCSEAGCRRPPTETQGEIQTPVIPQVRHRTWPRNEEGTYLPK